MQVGTVTSLWKFLAILDIMMQQICFRVCVLSVLAVFISHAIQFGKRPASYIQFGKHWQLVRKLLLFLQGTLYISHNPFASSGSESGPNDFDIRS